MNSLERCRILLGISENGNLIVRVSQIENRILNIDGVLDVLNTKINGSTENLPLNIEEIPVIGNVEVR